MAIPKSLSERLALPVVASPLFIISNPDLVIAQCLGGIVGSFPALNARPKEELENSIVRIKAALVGEVRRIYDGTVILAGAITSGSAILAARAMGADLAYMGTRFIATEEAHAAESYKQMIVDAAAHEIVYTSLFTGVAGNYLKRSIAAAGLDPEALPSADKSSMNFGSNRVKPWKDDWGARQGVGTVGDILPAAQVIRRLKDEYAAARKQLNS